MDSLAEQLANKLIVKFLSRVARERPALARVFADAMSTGQNEYLSAEELNGVLCQLTKDDQLYGRSVMTALLDEAGRGEA